MPAAKERTAELFPLAAIARPDRSGSLPETRVRGLAPGNHAGIGGCWPVTSTSRWGCWHVYGGTASGSLVQRYYASAYGRFITVDPKRINVHLKSPGSWNFYAYANGDPVGSNDPTGLYQSGGPGGPGYCDSDPDDPECSYCDGDPEAAGCIDDGDGGGGAGGSTTTSAPDCANSYTAAQVGFVTANYSSAATEANLVSSAAGAPSSQGNVTLAFLDWSAWESGWGAKHLATANHNYFGASAGSWGGTAGANCAVRGFACWSGTVSWGTELSDILSFAPNAAQNPTGETYGGALISALINGPNASPAALIQSIANIGFNSVDPNYGQTIAGPSGITNMQSIINCLKQDGRI
jgi:RHS repeat-associated protein